MYWKNTPFYRLLVDIKLSQSGKLPFLYFSVSGIELIFFTTSIFHILLTVIITHQYFGYFTVLVQCLGLHSFFPLCPPPSASRLEWTRCWERKQPGWVTSTNQKGYSRPYAMFNNKCWGKGEGRGTFMVMVFVSPSKHYTCWGPTAQKWLNTCPSTGNRELISPFALLELRVLLHFSY